MNTIIENIVLLEIVGMAIVERVLCEADKKGGKGVGWQ